jgi:hypothetical protein
MALILRNKSLVALYTDIGRGHPNYMDSTLRAIKNRLGALPKDFQITSVFKETRGLSNISWRMIKKLYGSGAQGGLISSFYNALRSKQQAPSKNSLAVNILGKDLRRAFTDYDGIVLVAHPMLAQILGDICHVFYIHGEIAAPMEFILNKAEKIYVPLEETAQHMRAQGVPAEIIEITGLMLEPELMGKAKLIQAERLKRINAGARPTFGFFNSGAYPKEHVKQIMKGINHILDNKLGRVILSAGNDPKKFGGFMLAHERFRPVTEKDKFIQQNNDLLILSDIEREKLTLKELEILPELDMLIMAAHERVNWSLGLDLPTILLRPNIGSFSGMNLEFTNKHAPVIHSIDGDIIPCLEVFRQRYFRKDRSLMEPKRRFDINGSDYTARSIIGALINHQKGT